MKDKPLKPSLQDLPLFQEKELTQLIAAGMNYPVKQSIQQLQAGVIGEQMSTRHGSGMDLDDLRLFQSGDDHKLIDWRASARSQQLLKRTFFTELSSSTCLVIDRQSSMGFGGKKRLKIAQAIRVALWFGGCYLQSGRQLSGFLMSHLEQWFQPQKSYEALYYFAQQASLPFPIDENNVSDWHKTLSNLHQQLSLGSQIILISDFMSLNKEHLYLLRSLSSQYEVKAVIISDPLERYHEKQTKKFLKTQLQWQRKRLSIEQFSDLIHLKNIQENWIHFLRKEFRKTNISFIEVDTDVDDFSSQASAFLI